MDNPFIPIIGIVIAVLLMSGIGCAITNAYGGPWKDHAEEPVVFIDKLQNHEMQVVSSKYKIYTFVDRADWFKIKVNKPYRLWLQWNSTTIYDVQPIEIK